jgi:uncharacterized damage-inducible protein DinB
MMEITALIAQHLLDVHTGNNWTDVNLAGALQDITAEEAVKVTAASPNTIASLLHHITYWNRYMIGRMNGVEAPIPPANGFDLPANFDWQQLKADNITSAHELANAIRAYDIIKLEHPIIPGFSSAYKNLQGTVEHVHYHLGQIVIIKNLIKAAS